MLFMEIIAFCTENYTKHTNTRCEQNPRCMSVEGSGTYSDHYCLRVKKMNIKLFVFCVSIKY
jgi:hypothetical protein